MRIARILLVAIGFASAWPGASQCSTEFRESDPRFELILWPSAQTNPAGNWRLTVWTVSWLRVATSGEYHIRIGPGSKIVSGDTTGIVTPPWHAALILGRTGADTVRIRGSFRVPVGDGSTYEFCEQVLDLRFDGRQIVMVDNYPAQRYTVRSGRRYRYVSIWWPLPATRRNPHGKSSPGRNSSARRTSPVQPVHEARPCWSRLWSLSGRMAQ
jgi:hypothetical protein